MKYILPLVILLLVSCTKSPYTNDPIDETDYPVAIISEVLSNNASTITDTEGDYDDYIEIRNPGDTLIDLSGFGLSDDNEDVVFFFPTPTPLMPDSVLLVWCDGEPLEGDLHADFRISASGEWVGLFLPSSAILDSVTLPELPDDTAFQRDDSLGWYAGVATPGE